MKKKIVIVIIVCFFTIIAVSCSEEAKDPDKGQEYQKQIMNQYTEANKNAGEIVKDIKNTSKLSKSNRVLIDKNIDMLVENYSSLDKPDKKMLKLIYAGDFIQQLTEYYGDDSKNIELRKNKVSCLCKHILTYTVDYYSSIVSSTDTDIEKESENLEKEIKKYKLSEKKYKLEYNELLVKYYSNSK